MKVHTRCDATDNFHISPCYRGEFGELIETVGDKEPATGANCLDYVDETECCGAPSVGVNDKVALSLARNKFNHLKQVEAQALITICAFCHIMYDTNELRIEKMFNEKYGISVLHYPQLLGLAMGMSPEELSFDELRVDTTKKIEQVQEGAK